MSESPEWVPVASVSKSHGVRGEVRLKLYNEDSRLLLELDEVLIRLPSGEEHEVSVDGARRANEAILMKLFSVDDKDRADSLRGAIILAKREDFPPAAEDEFYVHDALGSACFDSEADGAKIGTLKEVRDYPSVSALVITLLSGAEIEVPMTDHFVASIEVSKKSVMLQNLAQVMELHVAAQATAAKAAAHKAAQASHLAKSQSPTMAPTMAQAKRASERAPASKTPGNKTPGKDQKKDQRKAQ
jgi:16S rRNA processing protein RimM